jgi:hypothetical protein
MMIGGAAARATIIPAERVVLACLQAQLAV